MNIPFLIIRRDKNPHVSRACLPEALCMRGDNVKNKARQHFLQPGQIFGTQGRQPQLRLDSEGLQRKPWPQGHCQAAGLPCGLLCWELTVTDSMEFCSSSQSTSSTFTLCSSLLKNSPPSTAHHTIHPSCWCQGTSRLCLVPGSVLGELGFFPSASAASRIFLSSSSSARRSFLASRKLLSA